MDFRRYSPILRLKLKKRRNEILERRVSNQKDKINYLNKNLTESELSLQKLTENYRKETDLNEGLRDELRRTNEKLSDVQSKNKNLDSIVKNYEENYDTSIARLKKQSKEFDNARKEHLTFILAGQLDGLSKRQVKKILPEEFTTLHSTVKELSYANEKLRQNYLGVTAEALANEDKEFKRTPIGIYDNSGSLVYSSKRFENWSENIIKELTEAIEDKELKTKIKTKEYASKEMGNFTAQFRPYKLKENVVGLSVGLIRNPEKSNSKKYKSLVKIAQDRISDMFGKHEKVWRYAVS